MKICLAILVLVFQLSAFAGGGGTDNSNTDLINGIQFATHDLDRSKIEEHQSSCKYKANKPFQLIKKLAVDFSAIAMKSIIIDTQKIKSFIKKDKAKGKK